jgi:hypothetical protein
MAGNAHFDNNCTRTDGKILQDLLFLAHCPAIELEKKSLRLHESGCITIPVRLCQKIGRVQEWF